MLHECNCSIAVAYDASELAFEVYSITSQALSLRDSRRKPTEGFGLSDYRGATMSEGQTRATRADSRDWSPWARGVTWLVNKIRAAEFTWSTYGGM